MKFKLFLEQAEFDYSRLAKDKWHKILDDARKKFGIDFDTENDDSIAIREIVIEQTFWDSTKCRFLCELRKAGGDWQNPVIYFRCQLKEGYADITEPHGCKMFCYIPGKTEGNPHLSKTKNDKWVAPDHTSKRETDRKLIPDEKLGWKSLKNYLQELVNAEIKKVKQHRSKTDFNGEDS